MKYIPDPMAMTPAAKYHHKSTLKSFLRIAVVLPLFSKLLLILFLNLLLDEVDDAWVTSFVDVGFKVSVGSINGGLYAKYNGWITDPSNANKFNL
ncbi:hypothetical protein WICMUC_005423 [Wickerhamomyces mucosus]|uniref:Uncharacterized protein n=1 Tax=Wickerhamomyces mucosus TaxID=1378264 RepID=A0A9P8P8I5_9ASCO|nr:hypothetical protein WICMUC_005423 [Wickerhamomyces mucosus]